MKTEYTEGPKALENSDMRWTPFSASRTAYSVFCPHAELLLGMLDERRACPDASCGTHYVDDGPSVRLAVGKAWSVPLTPG
jgi:hypothetical protein